MPYDEDLANRLRELLADQDAVSEKKMFGGLAFLLNGNMTVAASHSGGVLARVDPADAADWVSPPEVAPMEMGGRSMDGWLRVVPEAVQSDAELATWVERSVAFVKTLPPK